MAKSRSSRSTKHKKSSRHAKRLRVDSDVDSEHRNDKSSSSSSSSSSVSSDDDSSNSESEVQNGRTRRRKTTPPTSPPRNETHGNSLAASATVAGESEKNDSGTQLESWTACKAARKSKSRALIDRIRMSKKSGMNKDSLSDCKNGARLIPRAISPFVNVHQVLFVGLRLQGVRKQDWGEAGLLDLDLQQLEKTHATFQDLLKIIPTLEEHVDYIKKHSDSIRHLSKYVNDQLRAARSDDVCKLKKEILKHVPKMEISNAICDSVPSDLEKADRGFYHAILGRLLVGRNHREEYDADPDRFCAAVTEGTCHISADDLPSFIYPVEGQWNHKKPLEGCLRSDFLVKIFQITFQGPNSAGTQGTGAKVKNAAGGHPPLVQMYKLKTITPAYIAYCVVIGRFALSSKPQWSDNDGEFSYEKLHDNVMRLFRNKAFAKNVLDWWNYRIFGTGKRVESEHHSSGPFCAGPSMMDLLEQQDEDEELYEEDAVSSASSAIP